MGHCSDYRLQTISTGQLESRCEHLVFFCLVRHELTQLCSSEVYQSSRGVSFKSAVDSLFSKLEILLFCVIH